MDIKEFFERQNWIFAKTYADKSPHEYILRKKLNGTEAEFEEAAMYIRKHGFKAVFWRQEYTYLHLDGHLYWTMGAPLDETILINRCDLSDYELFIRVRRKGAYDDL